MNPVTQAIDKVKNGGSSVNVKCPTHDDSQASLSVFEKDNNEWVGLKCHASEGCDEKGILAAVGLDNDALRTEAVKAKSNGLGEVVATYDYTDEEGKPLLRVSRYEPKNFRQERYEPGRGWVWGTRGARRVLYRLPEVLAETEHVYIVEGEKDVDRLAKAGHTATCNLMGAGKWESHYANSLSHIKKVTVVADRDDQGRSHAREIAGTLNGHHDEVQVVQPPEGCKDISDMLDQGLKHDDLEPLPDEVEGEDRDADPTSENPNSEDHWPPPSRPMKVARRIAESHAVEDVPTIRRWRGDWLKWETTHWEHVEDAQVRELIYTTLEDASYVQGEEVKPWSPSRPKVANVLEALGAVTYVAEQTHPPTWTTIQNNVPTDKEIVSARNGLLVVNDRVLLDHSPHYFNTVTVPFDYDPHPPPPEKWLEFLNQLWPNDPDSIATLQQWFGYVLSGRTDLHKILLLVGPTRGGKGTIARVLGKLIGSGNVAGPTLSSLGNNFGLQPLIGKPLAVVSDARLGSSGTHTIVERLLSISGEDWLTVDRKYKEPWSGKLNTRFMLLTNELPDLGDSSKAMANRFVVLTLTQSWLGHENTKLTTELTEELGSIFNWALDGLDSLADHSTFYEPESSRSAITSLIDLASPVSAFVREKCEVGPHYSTTTDELWKMWKEWCDHNGSKVGTKAQFAKSLFAAFPTISHHRPRTEGGRVQSYQGIGKTTNEGREDPDDDGADGDNNDSNRVEAPLLMFEDNDTSESPTNVDTCPDCHMADGRHGSKCPQLPDPM